LRGECGLLGGASGINTGGLGRQPNRFLLLVQKKSVKEKDTPHHGPVDSPPLLTKPGGGLNSLSLRQRPPTTPALAVLLGVAQGRVGEVMRFARFI